MNVVLWILAIATGWLILGGAVALTVGRVIRNADRQKPPSRPAVHVPTPRREAA